jgi:hypothetical protein
LDKASDQGGDDAAAALAVRLGSLAERWSGARLRLAAAENAVKRDKDQRRAAGLTARLVDAVTETAPEAELAAARAALDALRAPTVDAVRAWLVERTAGLLRADTSVPPWTAQQALRHLYLTDLLPRLREWHRLALDAIAVMEDGARKCRPVAAAEHAGSLGNWMGTDPPLISLGVSELARECVSDAMAAAGRLRAALPEQSLLVDLDGLDGIIQRLIDYLHQPVFSSLSHAHAEWLSTAKPFPDSSDINKHGQVAEKLEIMARMLTPLSIHLDQFANRTAQEIDAGAATAEPLLARHRLVAQAELPQLLRGLLAEP